MATVRLRIGPADNGLRMSLEEFREAEEEPGYRYELGPGGDRSDRSSQRSPRPGRQQYPRSRS